MSEEKFNAFKLYDAYQIAEELKENLYAEIYKILGMDWDNQEDLAKCPYANLAWDSYDDSLEFKNAKNNFDLTKDQLNKIWGLGFARLWINREDGKQIYYAEKH